ncbi:uncharacterized protein [Clytia hemisphaerica]|uniref:uncharacterized protein n=1 Tax=Clytia hemisphaerica TaxID=252671 RepID=UPI0034D4324C
MPKQWKLSFKVYVEEFNFVDAQIMNFIKIEPGKGHDILGIGLEANTNKFTFALQSLDTIKSNVPAILLKYTTMEFSCFKFNNSYQLLWNIDRRREYFGTIKDPLVIENVLLFISGPSQPSLKGKVRHLRFEEQSSEGQEIRTQLLESIPVFPEYWYVLFTFKVTEYTTSDWVSIIHFKKKNIESRDPASGSDLPGFHLNRSTKKLELAMVTRSNGGYLFRYTRNFHQTINPGKEYSVYVEMRKYGERCSLVSKINHWYFVNVVNLECLIWEDVEIWKGGPWYTDGSIELLNFKYGSL